jgi:hypothetical protein
LTAINEPDSFGPYLPTCPPHNKNFRPTTCRLESVDAQRPMSAATCRVNVRSARRPLQIHQRRFLTAFRGCHVRSGARLSQDVDCDGRSGSSAARSVQPPPELVAGFSSKRAPREGGERVSRLPSFRGSRTRHMLISACAAIRMPSRQVVATLRPVLSRSGSVRDRQRLRVARSAESCGG